MTKFKNSPWFWVLICFVVASTRFSEFGISLDPALFASVARNFAKNGIWWSLSATPNLFPEFAEHPFLAFWFQGLVFKLLGATDQTARIVGLITGCGTFYFLFLIAKNLFNERYAHVYCLVTLFSVYFVGRMPTFYLDVPLFFFMSASFYYFLILLKDSKTSDALFSGLMLGFAFLTKGMAALPIIPLMFWCLLYKYKQRSFFIWKAYSVFVFAFLLVALTLAMQEHYGSYSFMSHYTHRHSFEAGYSDRAFQFYISGPFIAKLFSTHLVQCVLALLSVFLFLFKTKVRKTWIFAFSTGLVGTFSFVLAGSAIGKVHLHYLYPVYPIINILAALSLYYLLDGYKKWEISLFAFKFAIFYQLLWHCLPFQMRRKGEVDFFQLKAPIDALKKEGFTSIEGVGIDRFDWDFRELAYWHWEVDTKPSEKPTEEIVVARIEKVNEAAMQKSGYHLCQGSKKYQLYVKSEKYLSKCRNAVLDSHLLR